MELLTMKSIGESGVAHLPPISRHVPLDGVFVVAAFWQLHFHFWMTISIFLQVFLKEHDMEYSNPEFDIISIMMN